MTSGFTWRKFFGSRAGNASTMLTATLKDATVETVKRAVIDHFHGSVYSNDFMKFFITRNGAICAPEAALPAGGRDVPPWCQGLLCTAYGADCAS